MPTSWGGDTCAAVLQGGSRPGGGAAPQSNLPHVSSGLRHPRSWAPVSADGEFWSEATSGRIQAQRKDCPPPQAGLDSGPKAEQPQVHGR